MNTPTTKPERNYGIDLLRMLAMFMVALLHVLGQGGILSSYGKDGSFLKYEIVWLLEIAAYGAVNCYALISGYVGIKAKHKLSGLISLTLQTTFYTVLITLLFKLFRPETVATMDIVKAFFPFAFKHYWYFSAYFCLFFFLPFLDKLLLSLSKVQLKRMIGLLVLVFSLLPTIFMRDLFLVNGGYSALWLAILYLIGGALRLLDVGQN
ncbi:MAG: acyltransferase, partial [Ruminococcaceae bacterium]|nr:acyltransferase [Oscillospiraceae bacterium]